MNFPLRRTGRSAAEPKGRPAPANSPIWRGAFKGFRNRDAVFEFYGGGRWRQNKYKYHYHYAYMPRARVTNDRGGYRLEVEGMNESVQVVRVR